MSSSMPRRSRVRSKRSPSPMDCGILCATNSSGRPCGCFAPPLCRTTSISSSHRVRNQSLTGCGTSRPFRQTRCDPSMVGILSGKLGSTTTDCGRKKSWEHAWNMSAETRWTRGWWTSQESGPGLDPGWTCRNGVSGQISLCEGSASHLPGGRSGILRPTNPAEVAMQTERHHIPSSGREFAR